LGAFQRGLLKFKNDDKTFEWSIVFFSNALTCICLILVCVFHRPFTQFTGVSLPLYLIMTLYFLGYAPYNCWLNKKRFHYDYRQAVAVTIIAALLANLFPVITIHIFGKTAFVKVTSTLIISALFYLPFWIKDFHPSELIKKWNKVKEYALFAVKFQGPLVFHSLSYYILNQSDRVMIDKFADSTSVAYYSVAYSLAMVIILVQTSLNQVLKPWRFKKLEEKQYEDVRKNSNMLVVSIGLVIIVFMLIVPEVFKILFTENYYEALAVMPPITVSVYFLFLYTIFVDIESYYGKTTYIAYVSTSCAILNVILNYLGLKFFNYIICAYTTLVCYVVMSFLHYLFMRKTCREAGITEIPADARFIWRFSLIMLAAFLVINWFYNL
jgi:O-antigen/teichoic acid export membrane protein